MLFLERVSVVTPGRSDYDDVKLGIVSVAENFLFDGTIKKPKKKKTEKRSRRLNNAPGAGTRLRRTGKTAG